MEALFVMGFDNVSHSVDLIEKAKRQSFAIISILEERVGQSGFVVLESCNRLEFYCWRIGLAKADYACLQAAIQQAVGTMIPPYCRVQRYAVEKLFKSATGLYTPVLGDAQIFGQVKAAYMSRLTTGKKLARELHQLFQGCFRASKRVIRESGLNLYPLSIAKITSNMLANHVPRVRRVAVLGTGRMSRELVSCMQKDSTLRQTQVSVFYHSSKPEWAIIPSVYQTWHLSDFRIELFDTVVTTLSVDTYFITQSSLNPVRIYDLGNPRNVDPAIKNQLNQIYDLTEINDVAKMNANRRKQLSKTADHLVMHEVEVFLHRQKLREAFRIGLEVVKPTDYLNGAEKERVYI